MRVMLFTLLVFAFLQGCKTNSVSADQQKADDFTTWSDSLTLAEVQAMYNSGISFMSDARRLSSIAPFSYKDSITSAGVIDTSIYYPHTNSKGITSVRYKDTLLFKNSWNPYYMEGYNSITTVKYGEFSGFKLLRIANESYFPTSQNPPDGRYVLENKLFVENNNILEKIDFQSYVNGRGLGEIIGTQRKGVIIIYMYDFGRAQPQYQYLVLLDLSSKKSKIFKYNK